MIFFGLTCETLLLPVKARQVTSLVQLNQEAVRALSHELKTPSSDPINNFLASIVLAAAAVLLRHLPIALIHVQGSFERLIGNSEPNGNILATHRTTHPTKRCLDYYKPLYELAASLDMHTAWYRLSRPPGLPPYFDFDSIRGWSNDAPQDSESIALLIHDCYHFAHRASQFKYLPHKDIPVIILDEHTRYISALIGCLRNQLSITAIPVGKVEFDLTTVRTQRVQCLSTLIYVSSVLQPYESVYDSFDDKFLEILQLSKDLIAKQNLIRASSSVPNFQLQPGIFQALHLTAIKCRDGHLRRKALDLFCQLGIEGPWNARVMSCVVWRAIEIEEAGLVYDPEQAGAGRIPESRRIHGCGHISPPVDTHNTPILIQVDFERSADIDALISAPPSEQDSWWEKWTEYLEISDFV